MSAQQECVGTAAERADSPKQMALQTAASISCATESTHGTHARKQDKEELTAEKTDTHGETVSVAHDSSYFSDVQRYRRAELHLLLLTTMNNDGGNDDDDDNGGGNDSERLND